MPCLSPSMTFSSRAIIFHPSNPTFSTVMEEACKRLSGQRQATTMISNWFTDLTGVIGAT